MDKNLLEIGKIARPHGIKGAIKVISYLDDVNFSMFKRIYVGKNLTEYAVKSVSKLGGDYLFTLSGVEAIEQAETLRNLVVYIDRNDYAPLKDKVYLSDLVGAPVLDENGNKLGEMVDYDDYGASVILTIKCGIASYQLPYVEDIISYDATQNAFVTTKQTFEDMRV